MGLRITNGDSLVLRRDDCISQCRSCSGQQLIHAGPLIAVLLRALVGCLGLLLALILHDMHAFEPATHKNNFMMLAKIQNFLADSPGHDQGLLSFGICHNSHLGALLTLVAGTYLDGQTGVLSSGRTVASL